MPAEEFVNQQQAQNIRLSLLKNITDQQETTRTPAGQRAWAYMVLDAMGADKQGDTTLYEVYDWIGEQAGQAKTIKEQAKIFGLLKEKALSHDLTDSASQITQAAKWFWENVEKPSLPPSDPAKQQSSPPAHYASPSFFQQYKYPLLGLGLVAILIAFRKS